MIITQHKLQIQHNYKIAYHQICHQNLKAAYMKLLWLQDCKISMQQRNGAQEKDLDRQSIVI
jgi:hypothetical protein